MCPKNRAQELGVLARKWLMPWATESKLNTRTVHRGSINVGKGRGGESRSDPEVGEWLGGGDI